MNFKIRHTTTYHFTSPVFLEPHYVRLKPRQTPYNELAYFNLTITPQPAGLSLQQDEEGNLIHFCWFEGMTDKLHLVTESMVNSPEFNPFDFLVYPSRFNKMPFLYDDFQRISLASELFYENLSTSLIEYGNKIARETDYETINFVMLLTQKIHSDFIIEYRESGSPHLPDAAFDLKRGSCRDLTWMQINLLRYFGIAARFVSGYYYLPVENDDFDLHAWLEVFLPGAGWIGFDPSHGMIAGHNHIPIVSSFQFQPTLPVTGTIRGDGGSELSTHIEIEIVD